MLSSAKRLEVKNKSARQLAKVQKVVAVYKLNRLLEQNVNESDNEKLLKDVIEELNLVSIDEEDIVKINEDKDFTLADHLIRVINKTIAKQQSKISRISSEILPVICEELSKKKLLKMKEVLEWMTLESRAIEIVKSLSEVIYVKHDELQRSAPRLDSVLNEVAKEVKLHQNLKGELSQANWSKIVVEGEQLRNKIETTRLKLNKMEEQLRLRNIELQRECSDIEAYRIAHRNRTDPSSVNWEDMKNHILSIKKIEVKEEISKKMLAMKKELKDITVKHMFEIDYLRWKQHVEEFKLILGHCMNRINDDEVNFENITMPGRHRFTDLSLIKVDYTNIRLMDKISYLLKNGSIDYKDSKQNLAGWITSKVGRESLKEAMDLKIDETKDSTDFNIGNYVKEIQEVREFYELLCSEMKSEEARDVDSLNKATVAKDADYRFLNNFLHDDTNDLPETRDIDSDSESEIDDYDSDIELNELDAATDCVSPKMEVFKPNMDLSLGEEQMLNLAAVMGSTITGIDVDTANALSGIPIDNTDNVEVEFKFHMTENVTQFLKTKGGIPVVEKITDLYFDELSSYKYTYASFDHWLRFREIKGKKSYFELKKPSESGHSGGISNYEEIRSNSKILQELGIKMDYSIINEDVLERNMEMMEEFLEWNDISPYAKIVTVRKSFENLTLPVTSMPDTHLRHHFKIDSDSATLNCLVSGNQSSYNINELELIPPYVIPPNEAARDVLQQLGISEEMINQRLNGKLVECIKRHNKNCYQVLKRNNIVQDEDSDEENGSEIEDDQSHVLEYEDDDSYHERNYDEETDIRDTGTPNTDQISNTSEFINPSENEATANVVNNEVAHVPTSIQLFVHEAGNTKIITVWDNMQLYALYDILQKNRNQYSLILNHKKTLTNNRELWRYGIQNNSTIEIIVKVLGGMIDSEEPVTTTPPSDTSFVTANDSGTPPAHTGSTETPQENVNASDIAEFMESLRTMRLAMSTVNATVERLATIMSSQREDLSITNKSIVNMTSRLDGIEQNLTKSEEDIAELKNKSLISQYEVKSDDSEDKPEKKHSIKSRDTLRRKSISIAQAAGTSSGVANTPLVNELLDRDQHTSWMGTKIEVALGAVASSRTSNGVASKRKQELLQTELKRNKIWFDNLTAKNKAQIRKNILYPLRNDSITIDVSSGKPPKYIVDFVMSDEDMEAQGYTEEQIEYFIVSSGYMVDDISTSPTPKNNLAGNVSSGGSNTLLISRQLDTIPDELKLSSKVRRLEAVGYVLYHLLNWKKSYEKWKTFPGNTPNSVCLVYSVSSEILADILAAFCNVEILRDGGYNSQNVSTIPNDVFINLALRMVRPTTSEQFLKMLQQSAKFPEYPPDTDKVSLYNFNVMIQLAYVYCDKIVDMFTLLCVDIIDPNILPSMYNRDEAYKGLKGVFCHNFVPSHYINNLLASFPQDIKEKLDKELTFQEFVAYIKRKMVEQLEEWKLSFNRIKNNLTDTSKDSEKKVRFPQKEPGYHAKLNMINEEEQYDEDAIDDARYFEQEERNEMEGFEDSNLSAFVSAFQPHNSNSKPTTPGVVGKQFNKEAFNKGSKLFTPKPSTMYSKQRGNPKEYICSHVMNLQKCPKGPDCPYEHDITKARKAASTFLKESDPDIKKTTYDTTKKPTAGGGSTSYTNAYSKPASQLKQMQEEDQYQEAPDYTYVDEADILSQSEAYRESMHLEEPTEEEKFLMIKTHREHITNAHVPATITAQREDGRQRTDIRK